MKKDFCWLRDDRRVSHRLGMYCTNSRWTRRRAKSARNHAIRQQGHAQTREQLNDG
jgi:hypothetical protein